MSDPKTGQSPLWAHINQTQITKESTVDLTNFKSGTVNFKLALWNPHVNGVRYLKALIYNLCADLSSENWARLSHIQNREVGNPITVNYAGESVCMDYLQAVLELEFIATNMKLDGLRILEIGAGYGRTCHAILSNHNVEAYTIFDLENCLELSKKYLALVLDKEQFAKVHFVSTDDIAHYLSESNMHFDLCINIDSFAEMDAETVKHYLTIIDDHCDHLYVKNPVGKYLDKSLDDHSQGQDVVNLALGTGILRDVIDIHDSEEVKVQSRKFVSVYQPAENWKCLADDWAKPWSYYWQALYQKKADVRSSK